MKRLFLVAAVLLLAACSTLAPPYERPAAPVAATWAAAGGAPERADALAADIAWQDFFADPELRGLVERALAGNRDLRIAALNIEQARALYRISLAERLPTIDAVATGNAQRTPATLAPRGRAITTHVYEAGIGFAAFELDLFGRVRSLNDQALQAFLATTEARRAAQISLVAEVANAYLTLAADRELLQLARDTLANQQAAHGLVRHRVEAGAATQLDLRRSQTTVEAARADVARYESQVARDENALELLVGAPLSRERLPLALRQVTAPAELPVGLPATVLLARPDVRAAEHQLQAANASIGAARANLFPRVTLTAIGGVASDSLADLVKGGSGAWRFGPQITLPLFDGGRRRAEVDATQAGRDIAVAAYERAIQVAFREVADALARRTTLGEQLDAQQALVTAASEAHTLSDTRFREGVVDYLAVLDAQRTMYAAQQDLIAVRLERLANQVGLYRALGGGAMHTDVTLADATPR